ncbi:hypothetical protein [Thioalkalivibrio sp. ALMg13-2]|uniref:hypothetical protein n=1 Tax=Thioalkalivibrio sp. ALMg13-2 TaxID=1158167 RepID=UPI0012DE2F7F|nr:hypothetical protein [Thioalkalivibrio sp. ALMg13-2]
MPKWVTNSRFLRWVKKTSPYQIFVARALQRKTTEVWYGISALPVAMATAWWIGSLNPVLDIKDMDAREGVVTEVNSGGHRTSGSIVLKLNQEGLVRYRAPTAHKYSQTITGKRVVVWSQSEISVFGRNNVLYQLEFDGEYIINYEDAESRRKTMQENDVLVIVLLLVLGLIPLVRVWWVNKNPTGGK